MTEQEINSLIGYCNSRIEDLAPYSIQAKALRVALAALKGDHKVPEGWKLMPVEPTPEICKAMYQARDMWGAHECDNQREMHRSFAEPRYLAALAAAPAPGDGDD